MSAGCVICARANDKRFLVYEDDNWLVRHSGETNILGYLLIESRRHILDLASATETECTGYGLVVSSMQKAVHDVTDCERIYTFSLAEAVPHYHLHVIPRSSNFPRRYKGRGIMQYPLNPPSEPLVEETVARLRNALKRIAV